MRDLIIKHNHRMVGGNDFVDDDGVCHPNHVLWGRTTHFPFWYKGVTIDKEIIVDGVSEMHRWWLIWHSHLNCRDKRIQDKYPQIDGTNYSEPIRLDNGFQTCKVHQDLPWMNRWVAAERFTDMVGHELTDKGIPYRLVIEDGIIDKLISDPDVLEKLGFYDEAYWNRWGGGVFVAVRDDSLAWDIHLGIEKSPVMAIPYSTNSVKSWDDKIDHYLYEVIPNRKAQEKRIKQQMYEAAKKIIPIDNVPVPKLKTDRNADNSGYYNAVAINKIIHNINALSLHDEAIIEKIEFESGDYGANKVTVSINPTNIKAPYEFEVNMNTMDIPVKGFEVRIDYPQGFKVDSIHKEFSIPNGLEITKSDNGILILAQASRESCTIHDKIYTIKLKNTGAIENIYELPIISVQLVDENGKQVKKEIITQNAQIIVE